MKALILTLILSLSTLYPLFSQNVHIYIEEGYLRSHDDTDFAMLLYCPDYLEACFYELELKEGSYWFVGLYNQRKIVEFIVRKEDIFVTFVSDYVKFKNLKE